MAGPVEATTVLRPSIWRRAAFGVGGKLQSAFSIVAGLTAISTVVSLLCFSAVEAGLNDFADRQMPIVANVIQLSAISGEISAAAARLINARTPGDQKAIAASIARKRGDLAEALQRLQTLDSANPPVATLFTLSQRLTANLAALEDIIAERSDRLRDSDRERIIREMVKKLRVEAYHLGFNSDYLIELLRQKPKEQNG